MRSSQNSCALLAAVYCSSLAGRLTLYVVEGQAEPHIQHPVVCVCSGGMSGHDLAGGDFMEDPLGQTLVLKSECIDSVTWDPCSDQLTFGVRASHRQADEAVAVHCSPWRPGGTHVGGEAEAAVEKAVRVGRWRQGAAHIAERYRQCWMTQALHPPTDYDSSVGGGGAAPALRGGKAAQLQLRQKPLDAIISDKDGGESGTQSKTRKKDEDADAVVEMAVCLSAILRSRLLVQDEGTSDSRSGPSTGIPAIGDTFDALALGGGGEAPATEVKLRHLQQHLDELIKQVAPRSVSSRHSSAGNGGVVAVVAAPSVNPGASAATVQRSAIAPSGGVQVVKPPSQPPQMQQHQQYQHVSAQRLAPPPPITIYGSSSFAGVTPHQQALHRAATGIGGFTSLQPAAGAGGSEPGTTPDVQAPPPDRHQQHPPPQQQQQTFFMAHHSGMYKPYLLAHWEMEDGCSPAAVSAASAQQDYDCSLPPSSPHCGAAGSSSASTASEGTSGSLPGEPPPSQPSQRRRRHDGNDVKSSSRSNVANTNNSGSDGVGSPQAIVIIAKRVRDNKSAEDSSIHAAVQSQQQQAVMVKLAAAE